MRRTHQHEFQDREDQGWLTGKEGRRKADDDDDWDFDDDEPRPDHARGVYIGDDVRTRRMRDRAVDGRAREFASADRDLHDRTDYNPERFGGPDHGEPRNQDRDKRRRFIGDDEGVGGFEK